MPTDKKNKSVKPGDPSEEKLKTDEPLSERDEVKQAEERTRKAQDKANKEQGIDGK